jgi:pimeloyl-ACP methyl ester carboxylesterase
MPTLEVDGVALHYDERGDGPPIVFSHGLLWSGRMYDAQVAALSSNHRCITYDHRGQGRSATSPRPYDMERLYEDAVALITRLGAAPCHFVGLSMGGFVGLRLAARRPELLRSLTLVESAADAEPWWNRPKYRAMMVVANRFGLRVLVPAVMPIMFSRTWLRDPTHAAQRRQLADELAALDPTRVGMALDAVLGRKDVFDELSRITTPTLVLHGREDRAVVPARAERTARAIAGAKLVLIPAAGHTSSIENADAVTAALRSFMDGR